MNQPGLIHGRMDYSRPLRGHTIIPPGQLRVLAIILDLQTKRGLPPTVREIMKASGFASPNAINVHLSHLEKKGILRRDRFAARTTVSAYRMEIFV